MMKIVWVVAALLFVTGCAGPGVDRSDSVVVIDAGHGGHDTGASAGNKYEKDLVLKITNKLHKAFRSQGYKVYVTRSSDKFLKLGQRTRMADKKEAKVFISIHGNALDNTNIKGIETYFLQKTRDAKSQRIAARENASVLQGTDSLSQDVIIDAVLNGPKIIESHKLAIDVQKNMVKNLKSAYSGVKDGGVRPAPFYVLVGASRPSILVELGYITNPQERERLFTSDYQDKIVDGIVTGVGNYMDNRQKEINL